MTKVDIKFYPNLKDNYHCFQASLKMVLSVFYPDTRYSYAMLDRITGYKKNSGTWDLKALLWLTKNGLSIKKISIFDYVGFAQKGKDYLRRFWRTDIYEAQESQSNFHEEQQRAQRLVKTDTVKLYRKYPTLDLLEQHLKSGWLAIIHIDVSLFDGTSNYSPHSIVVTRIDHKNVFFHDPGLPPEADRRVSRVRFAKVVKHGELILIKDRNNTRTS